MKKEYKNPIATVVKVQPQTLLEGSGPGLSPEEVVPGDPVFAPRHNQLFGDENTRVQD